MKNEQQKQLTDEEFLYFQEVEHNRDVPTLSDAEWLALDPQEVGHIFADKIKELSAESKTLTKKLERKLKIIAPSKLDEFTRWFIREYLKVTEAGKIIDIRDKIACFKRLFAPADHKSHDLDNAINIARQTSLVEIAGQDIRLRKTGKTYFGLCPLHAEHTPSFHIYTQDNRYYCFGCQAKGDVIDYVMRRQNLSFVEAVKALARGGL